jgi:hypothetical protein
MSVTVFVWKPHAGNIGHVTLKVDGGVYVSWWPNPGGQGVSPGTLAKKGQVAPMFGSNALASSMAVDIRSEGNRNPDWASAPIKGLDEGAINKWYQQLSPKSPLGPSRHTPLATVGQYSLWNKQCASTVVTALLVGGLGPSRYPLAAAILAKVSYVTPLDVIDIASAMSGEVGTLEAAKNLITPSARNLVPYFGS